MTLDEYQQQALSTCLDTCMNVDYPLHEIVEESAELYEKFYNATNQSDPLMSNTDIQLSSVQTAAAHTGKLAKARAKSVRRGEVPGVVEVIADNEARKEMAFELGDVLWGVAVAAEALGYKLSDIAAMNGEKLASRKQRAVLQGDGDHR